MTANSPDGARPLETANALEVLSGVATLLVSTDPLAQVLDRMAQLACGLVAGSTCEIWLFDSFFDTLERVALWPRDPRERVRLEIPVADTFIHRACETRQPFRLDPIRAGGGDLTADDRGRMPSVSALCCVPLLTGDHCERPIGFLNVWTPLEIRLSEDVAAFLDTLGIHVVEAVRAAHFRQIHEAQLEMANLGQRAEDASSLVEHVVKDVLPRIFQCPAVSMLLVNEAKDRLDLVATTGVDSQTGHRTVWYERGEGLTGWVWKHKRSLRIPDHVRDKARQEWLLGKYDPPPVARLKSEERLPRGMRAQLLAVPMLLGDEVVGVLRFGGRRDEWRFSEDDQDLARVVADQLAQIVSHRRAIDRKQQQLQALIRVAERIQLESDEETALRLVLAGITSGKGLGFNRAAVWTCDPQHTRLTARLAVGAEDGEAARHIWEDVGTLSLEDALSRARNVSLDEPLSRAFRQASVDLAGGQQDVLSVGHREGWPKSALDAARLDPDLPNHATIRLVFGEHLFALAPLLAGEKCLGVVYADNAFDRKPIRDSDVEILGAFARQAGLVVANIREAKAREERADLHERLASIIVGATDPDTMVDRVLGALQERLGFERWILYFHDQSTRLVSILGSRGFTSPPDDDLSFTSDATGALAPKVVREGTPHFSHDIAHDPEISAFWRTKLNLQGPLLAYPLTGGETVCGVLVVNDPRLAKGHQEILGHFENDLAAAVTVVAFGRRLAERKKVLQLVQMIQTAFAQAGKDEAWFLNDVAWQLQAITRSSLCAVYRPLPTRDEEPQRFSRVVALGYPPAIVDDEREAGIGDRAGLTAHVLAGDPVLTPDVDKDSRWRGKQRVEITHALGSCVRSFLGVPLKNLLSEKPTVIGAITLTRRRLSDSDGLAFQPDDQGLLEAVATAVSSLLTLKNAWQESQRQFAALSSLHAVGQSLTPLTYQAPAELTRLLEAIAAAAVETLKADLVTLYQYRQDRDEFEAPPTLAGDFRQRDAMLGPVRKGDAPRKVIEKRAPLYSSEASELIRLVQDDDPSRPQHCFVEREGVVSSAGIPLAAGGEAVGVMFVNYRSRHLFAEVERLAIETFASYAALAIQSARGIVRLVRSRDQAFEQVLGAISHRLRNTLAPISGALNLALDEQRLSPRVQELGLGALAEVRRAQRIIREYESFSRSGSRPLGVVVAAPLLLQELFGVVQYTVSSSDAVVRIGREDAQSLVRVSRDGLKDDFVNFAQDSLRHRPEGLVLTLLCDEVSGHELGRVGLPADQYVRIRYTDNGPGIPTEEKEHVFEPFFTTMHGSGLGLAIARRNAAAHGGTLVESGKPGQGACFELFLPVAREEQRQGG